MYQCWPELDGTWGVPNKLHSNYFCGTFFSPLHAADTVAFQHFPAQDEMCSNVKSLGLTAKDTNASPILLTILCTVAILIPSHPSFSTELKLSALHSEGLRASFHHLRSANFPTSRQARCKRKKATHLAGGEEEGEGTSEDAHVCPWLVRTNFNNGWEGSKGPRACLSFWSGAAFSRVWRGPPHHRLP